MCTVRQYLCLSTPQEYESTSIGELYHGTDVVNCSRLWYLSRVGTCWRLGGNCSPIIDVLYALQYISYYRGWWWIMHVIISGQKDSSNRIDSDAIVVWHSFKLQLNVPVNFGERNIFKWKNFLDFRNAGSHCILYNFIIISLFRSNESKENRIVWTVKCNKKGSI